MKRFIKAILSLLIFTVITSSWYSNALNAGEAISTDNFPFSQVGDTQSSAEKTDLWNRVSIKEPNWILNWLLDVFGLNSEKLSWDHKFLNYAKGILNIALWLISVIALIMTIYTFYMMFFSENEAGIKKAKWNLVWIFIALWVIGLAWIIVSFIFWRYQSNLSWNSELFS